MATCADLQVACCAFGDGEYYEWVVTRAESSVGSMRRRTRISRTGGQDCFAGLLHRLNVVRFGAALRERREDVGLSRAFLQKARATRVEPKQLSEERCRHSWNSRFRPRAPARKNIVTG